MESINEILLAMMLALQPVIATSIVPIYHVVNGEKDYTNKEDSCSKDAIEYLRYRINVIAPYADGKPYFIIETSKCMAIEYKLTDQRGSGRN